MKERLINKLLAYLFKSVNPLDVISTKKDVFGKTQIYIGDYVATASELKSLAEEVKFIEKSRYWKLVTERIRADAMEKGFTKSTSFDDLKTCKMMLYNLDIIESVAKVIKEKASVL